MKIHIIIETDEKGGIHINTETTPTKPAPPPLNIPFDGFLPPSTEWKFKDSTRHVNIGERVYYFQGEIQYRLFKFVAKEETDLRKCWKDVWDYESFPEWRMIRSTAMELNKKLLNWNIPVRIRADTKRVYIVPLDPMEESK